MKKMKFLSVSICAFLFLFATTFDVTANEAGTKKKKEKKDVIEKTYDRLAAKGYGEAGCGLGSVIFGSKDGPAQIFASTTNGFMLNNTFGVTAGTSNCDVDQSKTTDSSMKANLEKYVSANRVMLETQISQGSGEAIENLCVLTKCLNARLLGLKLQKNYQNIFPETMTDFRLISKSIWNVIFQEKDVRIANY